MLLLQSSNELHKSQFDKLKSIHSKQIDHLLKKRIDIRGLFYKWKAKHAQLKLTRFVANSSQSLNSRMLLLKTIHAWHNHTQRSLKTALKSSVVSLHSQLATTMTESTLTVAKLTQEVQSLQDALKNVQDELLDQQHQLQRSFLRFWRLT
jgi:hypothetical protein